MLENEERKTVRNVFLMLIEVGRVELAGVREYCPGGSDILIKKALYILHVTCNEYFNSRHSQCYTLYDYCNTIALLSFLYLVLTGTVRTQI